MCKRSLGETPSGSKYRFNPDEDKGKVGLGRKSIILQLIFEKVSARLQGVLDAKFPFKGISYLAGMAMAWYPCCSVIGWEQPKGSMTRGEPPEDLKVQHLEALSQLCSPQQVLLKGNVRWATL